MKTKLNDAFTFLLHASNREKLAHQDKALKLLFEPDSTAEIKDNHFQKLSKLLENPSSIFIANHAQKEVYHSDTGTSFVPKGIKRILLNIKSRFIARPAGLKDLQIIVSYAFEHKLHYTIRGAATWPFGGAVPLDNDFVLDLSYIDFYRLYPSETLVIGAGAIFADIRMALKKQGFALCSEITNPNSGTICGWLATGGLGLGSYKYGHAKESVIGLLMLTAKGEWLTLTEEDDLFHLAFGSEGQIGIIAGALLKIRQLNYFTKPYAFEFSEIIHAQKFMQELKTLELTPTSVLLYDKEYLKETGRILMNKSKKQLEQALEDKDEIEIKSARDQKEIAQEITEIKHVLVMEFDSEQDYRQALKFPPFGAYDDRRRYREISYRRLSVKIAHKLWEHRYLPVEMKQVGPGMLVSETIIPLAQLALYIEFIHSSVSRWTGNVVKFEGHLLKTQEILLQNVILCDPNILRHKFYFAMVPFMTQAALHIGGRIYGTGIWNLPFHSKISNELLENKKKLDPNALINHGKYIDSHGNKWTLRLFNFISAFFWPRWVKLLANGKQSNVRYSPARLSWNFSKSIMPMLVSPKARTARKTLGTMIAHCAECDSCERVCPTSEIFGLYGAATPIMRRKTAERLALGKKISQKEAMGFLACTRCDNCTRVCPTDIELTKLFDRVEEMPLFQQCLQMNNEQRAEFIDRFWQISKESPLYRSYTLSEHKGDKSHLEHRLNILYPRGFAHAELFIDSKTCIRCGMCADENACTYGARKGAPREIPVLIDANCSLCNACINYCPQNKVIQKERRHLNRLLTNAPDREEKEYWLQNLQLLRDTTTVRRSSQLTSMADIYITEEILMEIDREASGGNIPVSGMGQGDRHMGIGFDAERFSHFHIVGPAQNRLHEGDPDEELSVILGKRYRYCKFDDEGAAHSPDYPKIKLHSPFLYNCLPLDSHGRAEMALIKVVERQKTLVFISLQRLLDHYDFFLEKEEYRQLPPVIVPRVDHELLHYITVNPHTKRQMLRDLWHMPVFEISHHKNMGDTIDYLVNSVIALNKPAPLLCGYLEIAEKDMVGSNRLLPETQVRVEDFLRCGVDIIHIHGLRNKDGYYVTSGAVHAVHHYLLQVGMRHTLSLIASGGIRLASDAQKTVQRGAEATLMDISALLALDPSCYKAILEQHKSSEALLRLDIEQAINRLEKQMESRKIQILEVLGAAGFKDIKKTVGEEGRLIDFYQLEERIQRTIFGDENKLEDYKRINDQLLSKEIIPDNFSPRYNDLQKQITQLRMPHNFYHLSEVNQEVYRRDHVWPGWIIESIGRMAAGDPELIYLKNVKGTGLLGDGFDVMEILYSRDPDLIETKHLNQIKTAIALDKHLLLRAPWMFGGKSVGSIGLDSWKAHVIVARQLGIQYDTGEGGYPTSFFLNEKGEPIFFRERDIQEIKKYFSHDNYYTGQKIREILDKNQISENSHPEIFARLKEYPDLQPFLFYTVVDKEDEPYISTELKTGLFGVNKETIKKARRVVIAYSQGAKMGIGGHILAQKVNRLVSYLRGVEGLPVLNIEKLQILLEKIEKIEKNSDHHLQQQAQEAYPHLSRAHDDREIFPELQNQIWLLRQKAYQLKLSGHLDSIECQKLLNLCEETISLSYTSIISPFPFHNCYSIEDVKAFIDMVHMINPRASISIKISPSVDIEFIATGLARIARDNSEEAAKIKQIENPEMSTEQLEEYVREHGMVLEIWLDGPRGGTGASPNIIKGQMGMHIEYAIPLIHQRLTQDGLRNHVKFMVSGGIRTYEDVIKAVALGADGVIWGTAPLVAIGCDRNRNCHDGCSRGIATTNLIMQKLRNVEFNCRQMANVFLLMQMQLIRALAGLKIKDIRELRGRYDKIHWIGLKERVDYRNRQQEQYETLDHPTARSNCGVAAIIASENVPSYILDQALDAMKNRGMDGVGVGKTLCFPQYPDHYAYRIMVKGLLQSELEKKGIQPLAARKQVLHYRQKLAELIKKVFLDDCFEFSSSVKPQEIRERYKSDSQGQEYDYRRFGGINTDPGDIFCWFIRVKPKKLCEFIEQKLFQLPRFAYLREYFSHIDFEHYRDNDAFLAKCEDIFVFEHSLLLSQALYVYKVKFESWRNFAEGIEDDLVSIEQNGEKYLTKLRDFFTEFPYLKNKEKYEMRNDKIATVMSCGKNFAVWKTAGSEIPWQTPAAPNNIIHVRLATGSAVEQMNAHPFARLHTALTHNGETTNYEALKQRVEQFGIPPLATTDTEVASSKFHLIAEELNYPDWAVFESFSPTTGDDLTLLGEELRGHLEEVQRVEFSSSPDGPYQYLCLRHQPRKNMTERIDLKDPADLRPSITALWLDPQQKRYFSMIASEEQVNMRMMQLLDHEKLTDGAIPDITMVSDGMISRIHYNNQGLEKMEFIDRYGRPMDMPFCGEHYSARRNQVPDKISGEVQQVLTSEDKISAIRQALPQITFCQYHGLWRKIADQSKNSETTLKLFTYFIDHMRTLDSGTKAKSSLLDITLKEFYRWLENLPAQNHAFALASFRKPLPRAKKSGTLVIDAEGFLPQGTDPDYSLAALLSKAYTIGWRKFIIFRTAGQRLISTAAMGHADTSDVTIDVYGIPGEYLGAFMQGGLIRVHGNCQNFTGMCMQNGTLQVFGNAGKVCGYASKGGNIFILGDINDRAWTNSVSDIRCQTLKVHILGSAGKYAGESLMGGDFFFGGLYFNHKGKLSIQTRPYRSTKLLCGASRGRMLFFDPYRRLVPVQYAHGQIHSIEDWDYWYHMVLQTLQMAGVSIKNQKFIADDKEFSLTPKNFILLKAKGNLKGYESH